MTVSKEEQALQAMFLADTPPPKCQRSGLEVDCDPRCAETCAASPLPRCARRHKWDTRGDGSGWYCRLCGVIRDEVRRRRNRGNKARGAAFERTVAKALGGRRTGPLGGRDDVVGENFAAQTKKTINFSVRQARAYLDDLARIYPTRTALVIHAEPGKDREAIVVLRLSDWQAWHGPDAVGTQDRSAACPRPDHDEAACAATGGCLHHAADDAFLAALEVPA